MEPVRIVSTKAVIGILLVLALLVAASVGMFYHLRSSDSGTSDSSVVTDASLTGRVVYRERVPLPPGSSIVVQLLDVTDAAAGPVVVAEQTIITRGENVPIDFAVPYWQSQIDPNRQYALEASILGEDNLYFLTPELTPVLTNNNPTAAVDLLLTRDGVALVTDENGEVGAATIEGTVWQWVRTENDAISGTPLLEPAAEKNFVLTLREGGTFNSTTDCNRIAGAYSVTGSVVTFNSIQMTEMACPDALDTRYAAALGQVSEYVLLENELRLTLQQDSGTMIFTRVDTDTPELVTKPEPDAATSSPVTDEADQVMCTMDVMTCPDGSFVGRVAPSCAFAPCPGV